MKIFYSASQNGFYDDNQVHPDDAIEITDSLRTELITAQNGGGVIRPGSDGMPIIVPSSDYVPELNDAEQLALAESKKKSLLSQAAARIGPLQDAVDLEIATTQETESLKAWKTYRVMLTRVDTSRAPDINWPVSP